MGVKGGLTCRKAVYLKTGDDGRERGFSGIGYLTNSDGWCHGMVDRVVLE